MKADEEAASPGPPESLRSHCSPPRNSFVTSAFGRPGYFSGQSQAGFSPLLPAAKLKFPTIPLKHLKRGKFAIKLEKSVFTYSIDRCSFIYLFVIRLQI